MIIKLLEITFGDYLVKVPVSILSEKTACSGAATPHLAQMNDCRWGIIDEGESEYSLKKNSIKRLSGGDSYYYRGLYQESAKAELTATLLIVTNEPAPIVDHDKPTRDRVKIIMHLNKWTENPEECQKNNPDIKYFKLDPFFDKRVSILAPAFLWILTQYFPKYMNEGLVDPPSVTLYTEEYWKNNDVYGLFISERIVEVFLDGTEQKDINCTITLSEILTEFKAFFKISYPNDPVPGRDIIRVNFISRLGPYPRLGWQGLSLQGGVMDNTIAPFQPTKMN
jgi:phage/plasmid-associated DNA primase